MSTDPTHSLAPSSELSPSRVAQLRRNAKRLAKSENVSHARALDNIAQQHGFSNWSLLSRKAASWAPPKSAGSPAEQHQEVPRQAKSGPPNEAPMDARPLPALMASQDDSLYIRAIIERFERITQGAWPQGRLSLLMDLEACHCNGCALDLQGLLENARDEDLVHDVAGIARHLNCSTGKLEDLFYPRYAAREGQR